MNDADKSDRGSSPPQGDEGVLANLPRTRPQRTSRRRTEAREATVGSATTRTTRARARSPQDRVPRGGFPQEEFGPPVHGVGAEPPGDSSEDRDSVPTQGFESESDIASGSVQPPGGAELAASAAEIVAELAKAGLSAGERLLGDLLARLPRP